MERALTYYLMGVIGRSWGSLGLMEISYEFYSFWEVGLGFWGWEEESS
jgi:hypothetical protein